MTSPVRSPVALRVGQMMTGFGVGCGVGIGVGYPIALGSIPVLGDLMSATSSAGSRAFGGVGRKAFGLLGKFGIKNLNAGAGCGVGIGHGFGVGIALKPGVSRQVLQLFQERLLAVGNNLRKYLPASDGDASGSREDPQPEGLTETSSGTPPMSIQNLEMSSPKAWGLGNGDSGSAMAVGPALSGSGASRNEVRYLQQENDILRTLLRHQELIEDLRLQNASILEVLSKQLNVNVKGQKEGTNKILRSSRKKEMLHAMHSRSHYPDQTCFDCRTYSRRRR